MLNRSAICLFGLAVMAAPASAADIFVPADYSTISAAIQAAFDGDVIHVSPGVYPETLDYAGKAITIRSTDGPDVTTVDATGLQDSVVRFQPGQGRDAVIRGFTLTNGIGRPVGGLRKGGGIYCPQCEPTIVGNKIVKNEAESGGGIYCVGKDYSPLIEANVIARNKVQDNSFGGGIFLLLSSAQVIGNEIRRNSAPSGGGGGLFSQSGSAVIRDNEFVNNSANSGGGAWFYNSIGDVLTTCLFRENDSIDSGGGLGVSGQELNVERCVFLRNKSRLGGGISFSTATERSTVKSCILAFNTAADGPNPMGGGLYTQRHDVDITETTLCFNTAEDFGGAIGGLLGQDVLADGCIFWGNQAPVSKEVWLSSGSMLIEYSDLQGGQSSVSSGVSLGQGVIDKLPRFVDRATDDLRLKPSSPCIDVGDPGRTAAGLDVYGSPRFLDGDLDRGMRLDMGGSEFSHVELQVGPDPSWGGTLHIDTLGPPGLQGFLWYGLGERESLLFPFGAVFVDFNLPWGLVAWPGAPSSVDVPLPLGFPPLDIVLQVLAYEPINGAGTFSNPVPVHIE